MDGARLLRVVEDDGFSRLKKTPGGAWELWLRDGVLHVAQGPTLEEVVAEAEEQIARRGQP